MRARCIAHDAHPNFPNTRWARESGLPTRPSGTTMRMRRPSRASSRRSAMLCFTWDGMGSGRMRHCGAARRCWACPVPGRASRASVPSACRAASAQLASRGARHSRCAGSLDNLGGGFAGGDPLLRAAWESGVNAPPTTAVGRLFDAAAALLGAARGRATKPRRRCCWKPWRIRHRPWRCRSRRMRGVWRSDWAPLLAPLSDTRVSRPCAPRGFHASLAQALCEQALAVRGECGVRGSA